MDLKESQFEQLDNMLTTLSLAIGPREERRRHANLLTRAQVYLLAMDCWQQSYKLEHLAKKVREHRQRRDLELLLLKLAVGNETSEIRQTYVRSLSDEQADMCIGTALCLAAKMRRQTLMVFESILGHAPPAPVEEGGPSNN